MNRLHKFKTRLELAENLGIKPTTIDSWQRAGLLTPIRVTRKSIFFKEDDVLKLLESHLAN